MDHSLLPLADYFWIAGIETISYADSPLHPPQNVDETITEDGEGENGEKTPNTSSKATARHSRQNSANRLSRFSTDGLTCLNGPDEADGGTRSNRSSATIRADHSSPGAGLGDFDFDKALLKFAVERESFLDDLTFSAGAKIQSRPPMVNPRAERIRAEDSDASGRKSPLRSIKGSIRRKISFRDMNSMRRQPAAPRAAASIRTAKRLSNYNSVIPPPEPLNTDPDMHPLKRRFEPTLLDRYPPREWDGPAGNATATTTLDEVSRRGRFPDYVPMFAFPNDIQIVSSDERPRSTWHGFTMTTEDNSKVHGMAVIVWTALQAEVAEQVEQRCERWRQGHMSNEERELAASLGVRLAAERAHLSQLLARLPGVASGSAARELLDEQISAVEEKIGLMAEMLRPLRHGAASKIDGLTAAGESGLWVPRAYGVLGRDSGRAGFWKEWLRAVVVPMTDGGVLRVPPSSPRVGRWQPLERYVVNLCTEAPSPLASATQVELGVRELRLFARREAANELPGSRSTDLYALCRCLSLDHLVLLFEHALAESRIIFASSHTAMLYLACHAITSLLYPLRWAGIFIPVLPARLLQVLDAPCPYIVGIEKRYEGVDLPTDDDCVLVDLDRDTVEPTAGAEAASPGPPRLPRQLRRKLLSLLQLSAPHSIRFGVPQGPPPYAVESFPYDAFSAENPSLFHANAPPSGLGRWVSLSSSTFGEPDPVAPPGPPLFNAFLHSRRTAVTAATTTAVERPLTARSGKNSPPTSVSPVSLVFPPMPMTPTTPSAPTTPTTPASRSDSGFGTFSATLREKRSGYFDERSRRSSSFGVVDSRLGTGHGPLHRPSLQFLQQSTTTNNADASSGFAHAHAQSLSASAVSLDSQSSYGVGYAPSTYAQSTLAASTMMPQMLVQPVVSTDTTVWVEGHCFVRNPRQPTVASVSTCDVCDERCESDDLYRCSGCTCTSHGRCLGVACLVCPAAFHPERVRAAFVRCLASLLYTYRKHLGRPTRDQKANDQLYAFDMASFIRSLPHEQQEYAAMMRDTQAFNEFIHDRERLPSTNPAIRLFDEIILSKKARGRPALGGLSRLSTIRASHGASLGASALNRPSKLAGYLNDVSEHIWRTASVPVPNAKFHGDYRAVTTRMPMKLDPSLMKEPRAIQGIPRPDQHGTRGLVRKQVPSTLSAAAMGQM